MAWRGKSRLGREGLVSRGRCRPPRLRGTQAGRWRIVPARSRCEGLRMPVTPGHLQCKQRRQPCSRGPWPGPRGPLGHPLVAWGCTRPVAQDLPEWGPVSDAQGLLALSVPSVVTPERSGRMPGTPLTMAVSIAHVLAAHLLRAWTVDRDAPPGASGWRPVCWPCRNSSHGGPKGISKAVTLEHYLQS